MNCDIDDDTIYDSSMQNKVLYFFKLIQLVH